MRKERLSKMEEEFLVGMSTIMLDKLISKGEAVDYSYFKTMAMVWKVYEKMDPTNIKCPELGIELGRKKTYLSLEEISKALIEGENKGDFLLELLYDGRKVIDRVLGKETLYS